jgi:hypothetical protein
MAAEQANTNGAMIASGWKVFHKEDSSLRGHFELQLGSGMVITGMSLHEKGKVRWVGTPGQSFKRSDGTTGYSRTIAFVDREIEDNFRRQALRAIDELLAKKQKPEGKEDLNF